MKYLCFMHFRMCALHLLNLKTFFSVNTDLFLSYFDKHILNKSNSSLFLHEDVSTVIKKCVAFYLKSKLNDFANVRTAHIRFFFKEK